MLFSTPIESNLKSGAKLI